MYIAGSTGKRGELARDWAHRSIVERSSASIRKTPNESNKQQISRLSTDMIDEISCSSTYVRADSSSNSSSSSGDAQNITDQSLAITSKDSDGIETTSSPIRDNVDDDKHGAMREPSIEAQVRTFLDGQLCIDSTFFGNIARFIKPRPKENKNRKSPISSNLLMVSTSPTRIPSMLSQRLVYTNAVDRRHPKLALFANVKIPADTELLL
jgi:hypothetical protein